MQEFSDSEIIRMVLDTSPMPCFLFNEKFTAIDCNLAAIALFAIEPDKPLSYPGQPANCNGNCDTCQVTLVCPARKYLASQVRYIHPGYESDKFYTERVLEESFSRAEAEGSFKFDYTHCTLYGEMVPCEVTIVPIKIKNVAGYICHIRDMRDSQRIRAEMKRRETAVEESRSKTRFLARMSHEIRTPMNAILGITELHLQKDDLPEEFRDVFSRIYSSSQFLLSIINDILDLSKVEAGKMDLRYATYETASILDDAVQLNLMYIGDKKLDFEINAHPALPARLIGDELRITQILNNLLSNAFKYTAEGKITFDIDVETEDDNCIIVFCVADTGQGMTPEQVERIFDTEYTRFGGTSVEGSGLGMTVVKQLVQLMQGEIIVTSTPDVGTTIIVRIPQTPDGNDVIGQQAAMQMRDLAGTQYTHKNVEKVEFTQLPNGRVLLVDDTESNLYIGKEMLNAYGLQTDTATDGTEVVEKIRAGEVYDVIFMDHMMPEMDGLEATKIIRDMKYSAPIVALTANVVGDNPEMYLRNGFNEFMPKPIDINLMDKILMRYVRDKHKVEPMSKNWEQKPTVLIIDDEPMIISALSSILRPAYNVLAAINGKAGLNRAETQHIDLIFLDVNMPGMDGFEVLSKLKSNPKSDEIPVIFLTGSDDPEDKIEGLAGGAADFIRKPFTKEQVLQRVKLYIQGGTA